MKNGKLIEWLSELPKNYEVNLSKFFVVDSSKMDKSKWTKKEIAEPDREFCCILDIPIAGIATHKQNKDIRFFINGDKKFLKEKFGKHSIKEI